MNAPQQIVVNNTEETERAFAECAARGWRISEMKRGATNSQWILEIVDDRPEQPELLPPTIHPSHPAVF